MRKAISPLPLVWIMIALAILVATQASKHRLILALQTWQVRNTTISIPSVTADGPAASMGSIESRDHGISLRIRLRFRTADLIGYQNLFQTDDVNSGIRVELIGTRLALILGDISGSRPPEGLLLGTVTADEWHTLEISAASGRGLSVWLDDAHVVTSLSPVNFGTGDVRFGIGFDSSRRFHGDISGAVLEYGPLRSATTFSLLIGNLIPLFEGVLLILFLRRFWQSDPHLRRNLKKSIAARRQFQLAILSYRLQAIYFSMLVLFIGAVYHVIWTYFQSRYSIIASNLRPGFEFTLGVTHFKSEVILLGLVELCFAGTIALAWALKLVHVKAPRFITSSGMLVTCCSVTVIMYFVAPSLTAKASLLLAFAFFILQFLARTRAVGLLAPKSLFVYCGPTILHLFQICRAVWRRASFGGERQIVPTGTAVTSSVRGTLYRLASKIVRPVVFGLCCLAFLPFLTSWFPVTLPNDFVEIADSFIIPTPQGDQVVTRNIVDTCLPIVSRTRAEGSVKVPLPPECLNQQSLSDRQLSEFLQVIATTAGWQGEPGRVLFHHSYIFVPATHFLSYGLDRAVPYLYGYGNTLFQAALMTLAGGPSLTAYFNTFPITECLGIVAIAALIFQITGSFWAAVTAFGLSLTAFYSIGFSAVFLAASFNPLRFFGLVLQLASMCFCARSNPQKSLWLIPLSAALSLFWNTEFAQIGLVGQGIFLFIPTFSVTLRRRAFVIGTFLAVAFTMMVIGRPSKDIVSTVELSLFNVGMPSMTLLDAITFFAFLTVGHILLIGLSRTFSRQEQMLRIAYIPVLALVLSKYLVNPSSSHLNLSYCFLLPMCLVYVPWLGIKAHDHVALRPARALAMAMAAFALGLAFYHGYRFSQESKEFRNLLITPMASAPWRKLNETTPAVTPQEPIRSRVSAIQTYLEENDTVLILSPFDQVISFYANPKRFCGHFELMSNLATNNIMDTVVSCALRSPHTLVVYDRAAEAICPQDDLQSHSRCALKSAMKTNLTTLRDRLRLDMHEIATAGDLTFYRPSGNAVSSDH